MSVPGAYVAAIELIAKLRDRLDAEAEARRACKAAVVHTIGGLVEGSPTSEVNYLQRLRELVQVEDQHKRCGNPVGSGLLHEEIEALEEEVDFGVSVMGELRTLVEELRAENLKLRQDLRKENNEFQDLRIQYEQRESEVIALRKELKSIEGQADELTMALRQAREL